MQENKQQQFSSISFEEELARAKWFKEDLETGDGWSEAAKGSWYTYWIKTFPEDEVPAVKVLFDLALPIPAKIYLQMLNTQNIEFRHKWDKTFLDVEALEVYPNDGGIIQYVKVPLPWPLADRSLVLYVSTPKEMDWFGRKASYFFVKNAQHPSKPEGQDGLVRATNGGNFTVVMADEEKPDEACRVFKLSTNLYNGWIPKRNVEWMFKRAIPRTFNNWHQAMIEGYEKYFKN